MTITVKLLDTDRPVPSKHQEVNLAGPPSTERAAQYCQPTTASRQKTFLSFPCQRRDRTCMPSQHNATPRKQQRTKPNQLSPPSVCYWGPHGGGWTGLPLLSIITGVPVEY